MSVPLLAAVGGDIPSMFAVMGVIAVAAGLLFLLNCAREHRFRSVGLKN